MRIMIMGLLSFLSFHALGASELKPGQIWEYKTRKGEENSRITILKIDSVKGKKDRVVHLRISGLKLRSNLNDKVRTTQGIGHVPVDEKAIRADIIKVVGSEPVTEEMLNGYAEWKAADGGVWSLSPIKIISAIEESMNQR